MKKTWIYLLAIAFALSIGCCPNKDKNCPHKGCSSVEETTSESNIIGDVTDEPTQDEPSNDQDEKEMAALSAEDGSDEPTIEDQAIAQDESEPEPSIEPETEDNEVALNTEIGDVDQVAEPENTPETAKE